MSKENRPLNIAAPGEELGRKIKPSLAHGMPLTRRGFLAAGLVEFAGLTVAPNLLQSLLTTRAHAAANPPRFMVVDMAGGFGFTRNFLVGNVNGPSDRLNSYYYMGLGSNPAAINVTEAYGLPIPTSSPFLAGLEGAASVEARRRLRFGAFCHRSIDDSPSNQTSAILLVSHLIQGAHIPMGLGMRPTASGGYTGVPAPIAKFRPVEVGSVESVISAVTLRGPWETMSGRAKRAFTKAAKELAELQSPAFQGKLQAENFLELVKSGYDKQNRLVNASPAMDPRQDPVFQAVYGIAPGTAPDAIAARKAAIVMNALKGQSGPGCIYRGGYDYHSGGFDGASLQDINSLDRDVGIEVGRIVEAAHRLGVPVMIQLITDGGSSYGVLNNEYRPVGDAGDKSMTVLAYYHPNGAPSMVRTQVGHYTNGQSVSTQTIVGNDEIKVAYAVLANYMNAIGKLGEFRKYGGDIFSAAELDKILMFG